MNLLHVVAMTRALGELLSPKDEQPEVYRWTDGSGSHVTCEFADGKLVKWELVRPAAPAAGRGAAAHAVKSPVPRIPPQRTPHEP